MLIDERIVAIIAAYACRVNKMGKERKAHHIVTSNTEEKVVNLWRLSSKLELVLRRAL